MSELLDADQVNQSTPPDLAAQDLKGNPDPEKQQQNAEEAPNVAKTSAFKSLGWLDRFLAVWILLAMAVGIILGEFVPNTGPALQKEMFVGVSVPIGKFHHCTLSGFQQSVNIR
jgi:hypothetical protein